MAPEQIAPNGRIVDRRTDVYALGATLFECLCLESAFVAGNREAVFRRILVGDLPNCLRINRRLPRELRVVVEKAMAAKPEERYATALDLAEDLRRVREFEPILAKPAGPWLRTRRWVQRNPWAAAFIPSRCRST